MQLRVVGDVHGCINTPHPWKGVSYRDIIKDVDWSVQLGDMGFNYSGLEGVGNRHVFIPGNHDNYDALPSQALDSYGMVDLNGIWQFFYVRGAWSIDINHRIDSMLKGGPKTWWQEEELNRNEMEQCLQEWKSSKPDVVMTHSCPVSISEMVGDPGVWRVFGWSDKVISQTQILLEYMLHEHQPKLWLFGHFHKSWSCVIGKTTFVCVDELSFVDYDEHWRVVDDR